MLYERREITHLVQTVEGLEVKAGVQLEAIYAYYEIGSSVGPIIKISFDVLSDAPLEAEWVDFIAPIYNDRGQLTETGTARVYREEFFGHDPVSILILAVPDEPVNIRLYPKLKA